MFQQRKVTVGILVCCLFLVPAASDATTFGTYVTGDDPIFGNVVFRVDFDPAVPGSAVGNVSVSAIEGRTGYRLDGIDFTAGSTSSVVVGTQVDLPPPGPPFNGAITQYDVTTGTTTVPDLVPSTNTPTAGPPPASGDSRPSTVLTTLFGYFYTENQFGFAGGTHRIMSTPLAGPSGTVVEVFNGALAPTPLVNFEGLEIVGSDLYFFAEDTGDPSKRALYSIGLTGAGVWNTAAPTLHLGGLDAAVPPGDGSDELDFDPTTGILFGSNQVSSQIIFYDTGTLSGGILMPGGGALGPKHTLLDVAGMDGIRVTPDGDYLVLTGLGGVIASVDIAGAFAGLDDGDINILYDSAMTGTGFSFDDLTPLFAVPEPSSFGLAMLALVGLCLFGRSRLRK